LRHLLLGAELAVTGVVDQRIDAAEGCERALGARSRLASKV